LEKLEQYLGHDHSDVVAIIRKIGDAHHNHKEYDEAAAFYRTFLEAATLSLGERHCDLLEVKLKLAVVGGNYIDGGMDIFGKVLEDGCSVLGKDPIHGSAPCGAILGSSTTQGRFERFTGGNEKMLANLQGEVWMER